MCRSECGAPECNKQHPRSDPHEGQGTEPRLSYSNSSFQGRRVPLPSSTWLRRRRSTRAIQFSLRTRPPPSQLSSDADGARIEQMFGSRVMRKVSVFVFAIFLACSTSQRMKAGNRSASQMWPSVQGDFGHPRRISEGSAQQSRMRHCDSSVLKSQSASEGTSAGVRSPAGRPALYGTLERSALFALEGANIGLQLGGQATDFVSWS